MSSWINYISSFRSQHPPPPHPPSVWLNEWYWLVRVPTCLWRVHCGFQDLGQILKTIADNFITERNSSEVMAVGWGDRVHWNCPRFWVFFLCVSGSFSLCFWVFFFFSVFLDLFPLCFWVFFLCVSGSFSSVFLGLFLCVSRSFAFRCPLLCISGSFSFSLWLPMFLGLSLWLLCFWVFFFVIACVSGSFSVIAVFLGLFSVIAIVSGSFSLWLHVFLGVFLVLCDCQVSGAFSLWLPVFLGLFLFLCNCVSGSFVYGT